MEERREQGLGENCSSSPFQETRGGGPRKGRQVSRTAREPTRILFFLGVFVFVSVFVCFVVVFADPACSDPPPLSPSSSLPPTPVSPPPWCRPGASFPGGAGAGRAHTPTAPTRRSPPPQQPQRRVPSHSRGCGARPLPLPRGRGRGGGGGRKRAGGPGPLGKGRHARGVSTCMPRKTRRVVLCRGGPCCGGPCGVVWCCERASPLAPMGVSPQPG